MSYAWDFHYNGVTFNGEAFGISTVYTYPTAGSYTVALRVIDSCTSGAQVAYATTTVTVQAVGCGPIIVISQVYGGGGNSGAYYTNDFIELFNKGDQAQDLSGWSVQYASATGSSWTATILGGSIPAGGYYLVQEAQGTGGTSALPAPDAFGTITMSATAGKVALVDSTTLLSGTCPTGASIKDLVGFGTGVTCYEGAAGAPAPSNTNAIRRAGNGCTDTNSNASDFSTILCNDSNPPRNSSTTAFTCSCP